MPGLQREDKIGFGNAPEQEHTAVYRGWMMQPDQYFRALYGINLPTRDPCKSTYQATGNRLLSEAHGSKDPIKDHPRNYRHPG